MSYDIKFKGIVHNGMWPVAEFEDLDFPYLNTGQFTFRLNIQQLLARIDVGLKDGHPIAAEVLALASFSDVGETVDTFEQARQRMFAKKAA